MDLVVCWLSVHCEDDSTIQPHIRQEILEEIIAATQILSTILRASGRDLATRTSRVQGRCSVLDHLIRKETA